MIFAAQICMLMLSVCLLGMYIHSKMVQTTSNSLFMNMLVLTTILIVFDTISTLFISTPLIQYTQSHKWLQYVVIFSDKMVACIAISILFYIFEYVLLGTFFQFRMNAFLQIAVSSMPLFFPAHIDFAKASITCYHSYFLMAMIIVGLIFFLFFAIKNFRNFDKARFVCFLIWSVLFLAGEIYNLIFDVSFAAVFSCLIGLSLLFYYVENPKAYIDSATGFYNISCMCEYVASYSRCNRQLHIGVIYSKIRHFDTNFLKSLIDDDIHCFKDTDSCLYLTCEDKDKLIDIVREYRRSEESVIMVYTYSEDVTLDSFIAYVKQYARSLSDRALHLVSVDDIKKLDNDERIRMEIVHALVEDRILTYIQPIYDIRKGKFTSGECLCRLKRSNGEIFSPGVFIPVAERTGLITSIESVMFKNLCKCLSDDRIKTSHIQYLDINLSIKKGERHDLVDEYVSILNEYNLDADKINLEITETDIVEEKLSILSNMEVMKSHGFRFSLDDFGTGESNLGYIIDMPVSAIKFDKELTQKAIVNDKARLILKSVVQMAHDLNINVVIEGVEDEKGFDLCKELDADYVQGYYFSKPLPIEEFMSIVSE